jgi:hypothetical protein
MRRTTFTLALMLLLHSVSVWAQNQPRDGNWWRAQNALARNAYITGFFDGTLWGHRFSIWIPDSSSVARHADEARKSFEHYGAKYLARLTNDQFTEGLNWFYEDCRNRSIGVRDAMWIVANELAGTSRETLDRMIRNWRRASRQMAQATSGAEKSSTLPPCWS